MPTTVYVPINLLVPRTKSLAGNSYFTVLSGANWDQGVWQFISGNESQVYGIVHVPGNISATPNAAVNLVVFCSSIISGTFFKVSTACVASGTTFDPTLTAETGQNVAVPGTANTRFDILFNSGSNLTTAVSGNGILIVEISHSGHTVTNLVEALFRVDLS